MRGGEGGGLGGRDEHHAGWGGQEGFLGSTMLCPAETNSRGGGGRRVDDWREGCVGPDGG